MTVNLPGYSLDPGEAFISGDISKDLLRFIKENKLGKVLPYQAVSYTHLIPGHQPVCVSDYADIDLRRRGSGGSGAVPVAEG